MAAVNGKMHGVEEVGICREKERKEREAHGIVRAESVKEPVVSGCHCSKKDKMCKSRQGVVRRPGRGTGDRYAVLWRSWIGIPP